MTPERATFHSIMRERQNYAPGSMDYEYRSIAARKLLWLLWGVPVDEWPQ